MFIDITLTAQADRVSKKNRTIAALTVHTANCPHPALKFILEGLANASDGLIRFIVDADA